MKKEIIFLVLFFTLVGIGLFNTTRLVVNLYANSMVGVDTSYFPEGNIGIGE